MFNQQLDISTPKNYTEARVRARQFGFVIRKCSFSGDIQVYKKGIDHEDYVEGTGVYETNDVSDAWGTMLAMKKWEESNG